MIRNALRDSAARIQGAARRALYWIGAPLSTAFAPGTALADVPWAMILAFSWFQLWWTIPLGLLMEWPAVRILTRSSWRASLLLDVLMNLVSMGVGVFILIVLTMVPPLNLLFHVLFQAVPTRLVLLLLLGPMLNTLIEMQVIKRRHVVVGRARDLGILWVANFASVGLFTAVASAVCWNR